MEQLAISPVFQPGTLHDFTPLPPHDASSTALGKEEAPREAERPATFQHADVHGVVGSLWNTKHHLQAFLELPFSFFTAS